VFSGIQRVVSKLVRYAVECPQARAVTVMLDASDAMTCHSVDAMLLLNMIEDIEGGTATREGLDLKLEKLLDHREAACLMRGDIYQVAGAFWSFPCYDFFLTLRWQGVSLTANIYDLIQIRNPEFFAGDTNFTFLKGVVDILTLASFVTTDSEYVAQDVRDFMRERLSFEVPVRAVTLATELQRNTARDGAPKSHEAISLDIRRLAERPFVLCVGTIEIRKNHRYLVAVWEELRRRNKCAVPRLVFVGRRGWKNSDFFHHIEASGYLEDWLFLRNEVTDVDLDFLYAQCQLTAYVSFAEGWGLPIGESLARGKPCVASDTTSMPEVGGAFVRYINPFDVRDGVSVFEDILAKPSELAAWEADIRMNYAVKTWHRFAAEMFAALDELRSEAAAQGDCRLDPGAIYIAGDTPLEALYDAGKSLMSFRMARTFGWHKVEGWGAWASTRRAEIRFVTPLAQHARIRLYLDIRLPPQILRAKVAVIAAGVINEQKSIASEGTVCVANCLVGPNGVVEFALQSIGNFDADDMGRVFYLGLAQLAYCREDDAVARIAMLEQFQTFAGQKTRGFFATTDAERAEVADQAVLQRVVTGGVQAAVSDLPPWRLMIDPLHQIWLARARAAARQHRWAKAEGYYARIIRHGSAGDGIWIQYGHVLKEQEQWPAALGAYRVAAPQRADDADLARHLEFVNDRCA
jgi:glycosyltransferase involved in cell wall biosynthesis